MSDEQEEEGANAGEGGDSVEVVGVVCWKPICTDKKNTITMTAVMTWDDPPSAKKTDIAINSSFCPVMRSSQYQNSGLYPLTMNE